MGVYINMKMPLFCDDCWMFQNSGGANEIGDDFCCLGGSSIDDPTIRPDWCPLVPIAEPHGRLGDLDALKERATKRLYASNHGSMANAYYASIIDLIDSVPTIIEAEEGE